MQPGDVIADEFELIRLAGSGGMGEVWQAHDRLRESAVALKVLRGTSESGRKRFTREALVLAELRHPGVVRYLAHGVTPGDELYLVMEWLEGEDLGKRLARAPLTLEDTVTLLTNVAEGLTAAHARGIVHRDLKPANLFLVGGSAADLKILDFGLARMGDVTRTRTGAMAGTPGYMAPEQARGEEGTDPRVDVFALGCVAFECLAGRRAFEADHPMAVLAKILIEEVPRVSDFVPEVPADLDALVHAMLAKDPDQRPRDAAEIGARLAAIDIDLSGVRTPPASALTRSEQRMVAVVLVPPRDPPEERPTFSELRQQAEERGARLERLADGSLLAVLSNKSVASDLAAQAAQCALAMRALLPDRAMSLAVGRGQLGTLLAGEAIDRAVRALVDESAAGGSAAARVVVDEVTAGLLDTRFAIREVAAHLELTGELEQNEAPRTLLGKATPCVGREREIAALEAIFEECSQEPVARAVLVTAAAGAGKSRLRSELLTRLSRRTEQGGAVEVWIGRGDPMRAGSAFGLIAQILCHACGIAEGEPLEVRRAKLVARVARHVDAGELERVSEFLGELIGAPFPHDESVQLRAARQDAMLLGDQMRRAFEDFIAAECAHATVILVLEDLHWGDLPTVKLIDSLLRNLRHRALMVLALARPEVHDLFPKLWAHRELEEVHLGGLTKKASERLVRAALGQEVAPQTVVTIVERAEGNAFYLEELIRAVASGRQALPETMVAMVEARLAQLDPEARRILRAGSVFGQTFWKGAAAALLGGQTRLGEWLEELTDEELVTKQTAAHFPDEEEYSFRHALLRDGAYAMLTAEDRKLGHLLGGDWLERMGEREAMVLAEHFERAEAKDRALRWYPRATEQALEGNDLEGALARAERGIACGASGAELGLLRCLQAEARNWHGDKAESQKLATEAMVLLPRGEASWYAAAREAIITAHNIGNPDRVVEIVESLGDDSSDRAARAMRGMALGWAATLLLFAGRYRLSEQILAALERDWLNGSAADPRVEATVNKAKASWALYKGSEAASRWMSAAVDGFEQAGDLRNACNARIDLAFIVSEFGAYEEAERLLRLSLSEAERMGLRTSVPQVKHNLGLMLMRLGKLEEAAALELDAIEALKGQPRMEGLSRTYLAGILLRQDQYAAAEEQARQATKLLESVPASRPMALAVLSRTFLAQGKIADALHTAREAIELLHSLGALEEGEALVRLTFAEALHAAGDRDASSAIAEARQALLARAKNIADLALRKSFLGRIEENARTMALAEAWLELPREI